MKIVPSDGAAFKTFTTLNISLRLDLVKLYKTEDEEIKFLFEGQIQKPQEELPSGGENAKSWKTKIFQGADFDQIQLGCQQLRKIDHLRKTRDAHKKFHKKFLRTMMAKPTARIYTAL